jgi:hypothetical protein
LLGASHSSSAGRFADAQENENVDDLPASGGPPRRSPYRPTPEHDLRDANARDTRLQVR